MTTTQIGNSAGVTARQGSSTQNEVQTISTTATGGTSGSLKVGTETTGAIPRLATSSQVQTALRALKSVGSGGVTCTGGALGSADIVCTFGGRNAGRDMPLMEFVNISLTGGVWAIDATTAPTTEAFNDSDMDTVAKMRARLTAINGTTYSSSKLDKMTVNDMTYALRVLDQPETI